MIRLVASLAKYVRSAGSERRAYAWRNWSEDGKVAKAAEPRSLHQCREIDKGTWCREASIVLYLVSLDIGCNLVEKKKTSSAGSILSYLMRCSRLLNEAGSVSSLLQNKRGSLITSTITSHRPWRQQGCYISFMTSLVKDSLYGLNEVRRYALERCKGGRDVYAPQYSSLWNVHPGCYHFNGCLQTKVPFAVGKIW